MSLRKALRSDSLLVSAVLAGKHALEPNDRDLVSESERCRVQESLALDEAIRPRAPSETRWDYVLGLSTGQSLIGVEVHPARDGEVKHVIAKKSAASAVLARELRPGRHIGKWFWVASGRSGFNRNSPEARRLAQAGIEFVGSRLLLTRL